MHDADILEGFLGLLMEQAEGVGDYRTVPESEQELCEAAPASPAIPCSL